MDVRGIHQPREAGSVSNEPRIAHDPMCQHGYEMDGRCMRCVSEVEAALRERIAKGHVDVLTWRQLNPAQKRLFDEMIRGG